MLIKLNFDQEDIKEMVVSHMRERGWDISEFEWLETNGTLSATHPNNKLRLHARCYATEIDDNVEP